MAQDERVRGRTVRSGGLLGGWIAGSVGGWFDGVRGQVWHTSTHLRISRPEWRDLVGLSGNGRFPAVSISARDRKTVARSRRMGHLQSRPAHLYPSAGRADLLRGHPGVCSLWCRDAIYHLTRSRAISRQSRTFWADSCHRDCPSTISWLPMRSGRALRARFGRSREVDPSTSVSVAGIAPCRVCKVGGVTPSSESTIRQSRYAAAFGPRA